MSLFSSSRCVLLLSDEGVNIYDVGSSVSFVDTIPWTTQGFDDVLTRTIKKKVGGKKLLILNDMVEQHYRKERVPRVSPFDKSNLIKRRLSAAFPSYPIRSSIKLKEKPPSREDEDKGGDIYLFAAVPLSDNIRKVLSSTQNSYANVAGFCLLPVESSVMIHALSKKLTRASEKTSKWTVFVGQHQGGGLRQIVTKNGELALTRMTPMVESDVDQEVWSTEITNELKGTMSYLSRFGYEPSEGLDVIIIANNAVAEKVTAKIDFECNLNVLTCAEAAGYLGVKIGRQEEQRFADPLHVAWSGRKASFVMPLQATQLDKIAGPKKMVAAISALLLAGSAYFAYEGFVYANKWMQNNEAIEQAQTQLSAIRQEHILQTDKKKAAGFDFLLVEKSTSVFRELESKALKPLPIFEKIGIALGPDIALTSIDVKPVAIDAAAEAAAAEAAILAAASDPTAVVENPKEKPREFEVVLRIIFPAALDPEKGVALVSGFQSRLKQELPNHEVRILKQVADLSYTGNFVGEATNKINPDKTKQDYEAQILIKGLML